MEQRNALEGVLSLNDFSDFKNGKIENNKENRKIFLKYSNDELKRIQNQAIENGEFEIAAVIRDVLKDKAEEYNNNFATGQEHTIGQLVDTISSPGGTTGNSNVMNNTTSDIATKNPDDNNDLIQTDGKFIKLWEEQQDAAKKISQYYKNKKNENILITPRDISIDGDSIFVNDLWDIHLFKQVNGEIKEIPLLKDKMDNNCRIREIHKIGDYYRVNLCFLDAKRRITENHKGEENSLYFIIDKDGNYSGLENQTGKEKFGLRDFGVYEFKQDLGDNKVFRTIFNKNMEKIAGFKDENENKKNIVYGDDKVCVLEEEAGSGLYTVFVENQIVEEKGTEEDLKGNEYVQNFLEMKKKKQQEIEELKRMHSTPFEERYIDKNHCKIVYKNNEKTAIAIENDKGKTLFELSNIEKISYENEHIPYFRTNTGDVIEIKYWTDDNNLLFISDKSIKGGMIQKRKSIVINKNNGEKKEFDGCKGFDTYLNGNLIEVCGNEQELYDDDFNYLGIVDDINNNISHYNNLGFYTTIKEENGEKKYYIVSKKTGKIITSYLKPVGSHLPYFNYYKEGDKTYLIVSVLGKGLCQVELP